MADLCVTSCCPVTDINERCVKSLDVQFQLPQKFYRQRNMSHFAYACETEGKNGISRLISGL